MNSGSSYFLQDNFKGMLISPRPFEIAALKYSRMNPFISRVTNKEPLGLPPIKSSIIYEQVRRPNYVEMKNKEIVKKIQKLKKLEKSLIQDEEADYKKKQKKVKDNFDKVNSNINDIRKELYGYDLGQTRGEVNKMNKTSSGFAEGSSIKDKIGGTNFYQLNPDYHNMNMPSLNGKKLEQPNEEQTSVKEQELIAQPNNDNELKVNLDEEENEDEVKNLLKFVNNLDYEKYLKDLEVREALYLIKNKVEKESANEPLCDNPNHLEYNNADNKEENTQIKQNEENSKKQEYPNVFNNNSNAAIHDKEWDSSIKPVDGNQHNVEEVVKRTVAKNILKKDKHLRNVHSYNSVKKLLEREGLINPTTLNTLKISVLKEKEGINNYEYLPSMLPNLRDQPII